VGADGENTDQANLLGELASSGARFAVTTGDVGYPDGSQRNYGDLAQHGSNTSAVFGPSFWARAGDSIPMFYALGNHGLNRSGLLIWPERRAVASSAGRYSMQRYCCVNGSSPQRYPSAWYAFNAGRARFYVLDAAWSNGNLGHGTMYENDHDAHWTTSSAEYGWLQHDLRLHHRPLAFAFLHFPLYADSSTEGSDPWLNGAAALEGLLGRHGVDMVFSGHAHFYERNARSSAGMPVSYVTGGGGATLEPVTGCDPIDRYAIGWSSSSCGAASDPTSQDQVFHFLLVTVDGRTVTVRPTDATGDTFDVHSFRF
jgi:hypothetical protein